MIVHHHSLKTHFKVIISIFHGHPSHVLIQETSLVIASNLEIAAIFAKTERKLVFLNQLRIKHHIVDGLKSICIRAGFILGESQNSVRFLRVEVLGFQLDAPESVRESIEAKVVVLAKVELIRD